MEYESLTYDEGGQRLILKNYIENARTYDKDVLEFTNGLINSSPNSSMLVIMAKVNALIINKHGDA